MSSAGFEPSVPTTKRPKTYALDGAATGICRICLLHIANARNALHGHEHACRHDFGTRFIRVRTLQVLSITSYVLHALKSHNRIIVFYLSGNYSMYSITHMYDSLSLTILKFLQNRKYEQRLKHYAKSYSSNWKVIRNLTRSSETRRLIIFVIFK
jgi:hypothetical protein